MTRAPALLLYAAVFAAATAQAFDAPARGAPGAGDPAMPPGVRDVVPPSDAAGEAGTAAPASASSGGTEASAPSAAPGVPAAPAPPAPADGAAAGGAAADAGGAAAPGAGGAERWTSDATLLGRWTAVHGDRRKFLEDYDAVGKGGGAEATISHHDADGNYRDFWGAILGQDRGEAVDAGDLHVRAGRWGHYHVRGDLTQTQSFYDDSREAPLGSFPSTNELGRELTTRRTNARLGGELLLGEDVRLGLEYRHRENDGNRSRLKGSAVESLAPFAFRFPAFEAIDVRSDSLDVAATFPAGPLVGRVAGGWTEEHHGTSMHEVDFGPTALRDRTRYRENTDVRLLRAGVDVATRPSSPVLATAGYRFLYADADANARQRDGADGSLLVRTADGISIVERSHAGHAGATFSPMRDLTVTASYTLLDQNREGAGTERRELGTLPAAEAVRDDSTKDLVRHRPRIEARYSGVPRTLLRARYAYERVDRDLDVRMLPEAGGTLATPERIERLDTTTDRHVALVEARVRATRRLLLGTGYQLERENVDEDVHQLVNEDFLGDRDRDRDTAFASARLQPGRRVIVELRGEYQHEHFDRSDVAGDSSTSMDAELVSLRASAPLGRRLFVTGLFSLANRDYDVADEGRRLSFFRSIDFRGRSATGSVAGTYSLDDRTTIRGQYDVVDAGGSLDNVNHRVHASVARRVNQRLRVAAGYSYLEFDEGLWRGDDFAAHVGWVSASVTF